MLYVFSRWRVKQTRGGQIRFLPVQVSFLPHSQMIQRWFFLAIRQFENRPVNQFHSSTPSLCVTCSVAFTLQAQQAYYCHTGVFDSLNTRVGLPILLTWHDMRFVAYIF